METIKTTTGLDDQIRAAIGAHGMWKHRLRQAIDTGHTDLDPAVVALDDRCEFGMWLHHRLAPAARSAHSETVMALHATFHREAADVLRLVVAGRLDDAETAVGLTGGYAKASSQLTSAMQAWLRDAT